ncbi:protein MAIN-LIKE 1-like isoform X5 [Trifolium pratense]|uniref:protein MAIN-LIKE 1-like isoform X5 n=1 Tax=Trifolium pratense TaxID=57577 RepID=UPI001E693C32|nr:protein MAIN-LIKE 1-like isoform X5 [Trifolium pratense]
MAINVGEGMTDEVGRQRGGWKSRARSSTRRERVTEVAIPRGGKGKEVAGSTSEAQDEPESQHEVVAEAQDVDEVNAEIEAEEKDEQPPPSPQKKNPRTTRRRNPPQVAPPPVTGYGGGPSDLSLLPSFGKHVAASLWRGECVGRYLKCMNNGKKVNDFDKPDSNLRWFWNVVDASGLRPLLKTNYNHVDWGLLTAFTKRWHPETGTFYLPISEMTITLDDVSCLLHIPINGKMLNHVGTACSMAEGKDMCEKYLNFNRDDCKQEFSKMKGAHIGFPKLEKIYHANLSQALEAENNQESDDEVGFYRECTIRAFLLYLIGATIFTNKSSQYVDVIFLTYLQDLSEVNTWNWGASRLAYLFNYLDAASRPKCGNHGGMYYGAFQKVRNALSC